MLGVALQAGHVPVAPELIERAITLNGVAVQKNLAAFAWGRAWVADAAPPRQLRASARRRRHAAARAACRRPHRLPVGAYAARFTALVDQVAALGHDQLTDAVNVNLHKLMAYKDEYEVARLLLLPESRRRPRPSAAGARRSPGCCTRPRCAHSVAQQDPLRPLVAAGVPRCAPCAGCAAHWFDVFGWAKPCAESSGR
jgi:hypothetical protein